MSKKISVNESSFAQLKDKVIVLTGGANGIGRSALSYLVSAGAHVVFGDHDKASSEGLTSSYSSVPNPPVFVPTDVTKYSDNVALFKTAFAKFGRVDHAVANAGVLERGKWFDPDLTMEGVESPETEAVIEVNLLGVLYFVRVALVYLRAGSKEGEDKSITLISSAAGFRDSPGLFLYQSSKHALLGLLRSTRKTFYERDSIRVNAICPAITDSAMTTSIIDSFKATGQAINTTEDVAKHIVNLQIQKELWGKAVYVEGGRGWEILEGIDRLMPEWMGEEPAERLRVHLQHVGQGAGWGVK